jgi:hypothetical protein
VWGWGVSTGVRIACIGGEPFGVALLDVGLVELDRYIQQRIFFR